MKVIFVAVSAPHTASQNNRPFPRYGPLKFVRFRLLLGNLVGVQNKPIFRPFGLYFHQNWVSEAERGCCAITPDKQEVSKKSKIHFWRSVPLIFLRIVSKFQLNNCILRGGDAKKTRFLKCENWPFLAKNSLLSSEINLLFLPWTPLSP